MIIKLYCFLIYKMNSNLEELRQKSQSGDSDAQILLFFKLYHDIREKIMLIICVENYTIPVYYF